MRRSTILSLPPQLAFPPNTNIYMLGNIYFSSQHSANLTVIFIIGRIQIFDHFGNRTAHIRHQRRKTTVLICQRCLINYGVKKMNYI
jgi:hypothetical protein